MYKTEAIRRLREKAAGLPQSPGVYLMKDCGGRIIYIGKSKSLKNRVSSYFTDLAGHSVKTAEMVSRVENFEYILTDTNMEALALENRLIKLHMPKFNIKLKDGKSYPYIKITFNCEYPEIQFTRRRAATSADTSVYGKAKYFGPYSGASTALTLLKTAQKAFGLASCKRRFPRDIGKERPCIYKQIGQCSAPCDGSVGAKEYTEQFKRAAAFLNGSFASVKRGLTEQMEEAAEALNFEAAAVLRDRIKTLEACRGRQKIVGSPDDDRDVIAFVSDGAAAALSVFFVREGCVIDRESVVFGADELTENEDITAFLCAFYRKRENLPRELLLDMDIGDECREELEEFLSSLPDFEKELEQREGEEPSDAASVFELLGSDISGHGNTVAANEKRRAGTKITVRIPEKGDGKKLCLMVRENAAEILKQYSANEKKRDETALRLAQLLGLEIVPSLIEAYDISNYGSDSVTAGKVSVKDGVFLKSAYRTYKIRSFEGQDDYAAMSEAIRRRLAHTEDAYPDLILLDGGRGHVSVIRALMDELGVDIPVFGMVKDEYHKTRAIAGAHENEEISIARENAVFGFVYRLQEEVHRYTVGRMRSAKRKTVKRSSLTEIKGIGEQKAKALLAYFHTLGAIKEADIEELMSVKGITRANAYSIRGFFGSSQSDADEK